LGTSGQGPSNLVCYAENLLWQVGKRANYGARAVPLTDCQTWILAQFDFLRSHMVEILVRSGVDLQAARLRQFKFDLPAAAAATTEEEETQTCDNPRGRVGRLCSGHTSAAEVLATAAGHYR